VGQGPSSSLFIGLYCSVLVLYARLARGAVVAALRLRHC
jgi:hypothetical protein